MFFPSFYVLQQKQMIGHSNTQKSYEKHVKTKIFSDGTMVFSTMRHVRRLCTRYEISENDIQTCASNVIVFLKTIFIY